MDRIKVSVIMPVYNAQEYLEESLGSLIHQTLEEIEIICIDDGSTDCTPDILKKYVAMDCRIKVLYQQNSGAGAARNAGLQCAAGEYLSILDADDVFERDMLEAAYRKAEQDEVDICVFKMDRFRENIQCRQPYHWSILRNQLPESEPFTYQDIKGNVFRTFIGWTWDKLFRREFVSRHQLRFQTLRNTNDMFFTFAALVKAEKISILNRTLVHQRVGRCGSVSVTRENSWDCFYQALLALREELVRMDIYRELERSYINYALYFSLWHLDTLKAPAFQLLYGELKDKIFVELGVSGKKSTYFWDQAEYEKYLQIMDLTSEQYRVFNGMQVQYSSRYCQTRCMGRSIKPKVSIVVPIYNVEPYLVECLNSVVNQTLEDIEIICVNDGSTDQSLEIVKQFAAEDERIVILDRPNGGYGKAMNCGLYMAAGEYVGIVEPDDYVDRSMYKTLYDIAHQENLDLIKADFNYFKGNNRKRKFIREQIAGTNKNLYNCVISPEAYPVVFKFPIYTWSGIYKSSFIKENHIRHNETPGASYQDNGFWFQTFCFAKRMYFTDQAFYQYRQDNPNSSVHDQSKVYCIFEEFQYIYNFLDRNPEFKRKYIGYYQFRRYYNYMGDLLKIADENKLEFIDRFHEEFKDAYGKKELQEEVFDGREWDAIQKLINRPMDFYADTYISKEMLHLREQIELLKDSKSWQVGSALVYLPKKILGIADKKKTSLGIRCRVRKMGKCKVPKVSVLIPVYNVEDYLVECLNSLVNQTLDEIEIICINDGSTDRSLEIVEQFAAADERIMILDGPHGGYGRAMNRGLDAATGEYIGIVEPDDYVEYDMYQVLYNIAAKEDLNFIKADFNYFRDIQGKRNFILERAASLREDLYDQVLSVKENPIVFRFGMNTWSGIYDRMFIKKNAIRYNETPGASFQDIGFFFQTFCFAERIYFLDKAFYQCRCDNPDASVYAKGKVYSACEEYQLLYQFLETHEEFKKRYMGYYQVRKYMSYLVLFDRIADQWKLEFVNRFHEEFKESYDKGELPEEVFEDAEWDAVQELIVRPMDFYAHLSARSKVLQHRQEIDLIKESKSWKIGCAVVYLPKKILGRI